MSNSLSLLRDPAVFIGELASWWSQQMLGFLPRWLQRQDDTNRSALIAFAARDSADMPCLELRLPASQGSLVLGRFGIDEAGIHQARDALASRRVPRRVVLIPHGPCLLEDDIVLPLAAEQELEHVLRFEIDRWTPFAPDELFWTWSVQRRDRRQGRLQIHLSMIPKSAVEGAINALQRMGIPPKSLQASLPDGSLRVIDLATSPTRVGWLQRRLHMVPVLVCATLGIAALLLPVVRQSIAIGEVTERIETLKPQVTAAEELRQRIAGQAKETQGLSSVRAQRGDILLILTNVTESLPDDSYLLGMMVSRQALRIDGRSAGAAKLITALATAGMIHNPRFAAPVTRIEGGVDVFSIQAEIGQASSKPPSGP